MSSSTCYLTSRCVQYLVSDYLSEITMSLLAAVKNKRPELGFCPDFLESTAPHLAEIKRRGIRVVTNGGERRTVAVIIKGFFTKFNSRWNQL